MRCPHCPESFFGEPGHGQAAGTASMGIGEWTLRWIFCPSCEQPTIVLAWQDGNVIHKRTVFPRGAGRPLHPGVPDDIARDFQEAVEVLGASPKASAALSRRMLQHLLRDYGKVRHGTLVQEIERAMPSLPPYLGNAVDAVRHVGNFAAHPIKSEHTGEVVEVEDGEAEWLLDTVEALIGFYIVQPVELEAQRAALNAKLAEAGKPELKTAEQPEAPPTM